MAPWFHGGCRSELLPSCHSEGGFLGGQTRAEWCLPGGPGPAGAAQRTMGGAADVQGAQRPCRCPPGLPSANQGLGPHAGRTASFSSSRGGTRPPAARARSEVRASRAGASRDGREPLPVPAAPAGLTAATLETPAGTTPTDTPGAPRLPVSWKSDRGHTPPTQGRAGGAQGRCFGAGA